MNPTVLRERATTGARFLSCVHCIERDACRLLHQDPLRGEDRSHGGVEI
jgi:hypothetical protein